MPWGVPVPDDEEHVMYVWFDALVNYISTLGWPEESGNYQKFWVEGETKQFAGKDQVRQQAAMWQAMLLSAGLPNTDSIFIHGFINSGGQKMSKSIGNVIDPVEVVEQYGTDALRYFLLRHIHPTEDSDWTAERFHESYMAHLVNGIGNLTNRILKMAETYGAELGDKPECDIPYAQLIDCDFNAYLDQVWVMISHMDEFITDEAPFKKVKTDPDAAADDVRYLLEKLFIVAKHLEPVLPDTAERVLHAIDINHKPEEPLFPRVELD
jgi:methionyl-tRNA synthetase